MPFPWKAAFVTTSSTAVAANITSAKATPGSNNNHHLQPQFSSNQQDTSSTNQQHQQQEGSSDEGCASSVGTSAGTTANTLGGSGSGIIISSVISAKNFLKKHSPSLIIHHHKHNNINATNNTNHLYNCAKNLNNSSDLHETAVVVDQAVPSSSSSAVPATTTKRHPSGECSIEDKPIEYAKLKSTIKHMSMSENLHKPKLVFHCQLAHGSPTGLISGFSDAYDLYQKMADCYDIVVDDILFCTLNSHKIDANHLLGAQLALDDFIFIHVKGQKKDVDVTKTDSMLGVTITDNGIGKTFVKRIKPNTVFGRMSDFIHVGDHVEKINDQSMVGKRHFEVAKLLRDLPVGEKFTLRLIEPLKAGFSNPAVQRVHHFVEKRNNSNNMNNSSSVTTTTIATTTDGALTNGVHTLRLKSTSSQILPNDGSSYSTNQILLDRLNSILESFLGISDKDLAARIMELGRQSENPKEFTDVLKTSEFSEFEIPEDVAFDLWGVVKDHKDGRLDEPTFSGYSSTKL